MHIVRRDGYEKKDVNAEITRIVILSTSYWYVRAWNEKNVKMEGTGFNLRKDLKNFF